LLIADACADFHFPTLIARLRRFVTEKIAGDNVFHKIELPQRRLDSQPLMQSRNRPRAYQPGFVSAEWRLHAGR
jgi:hypothetical protein